MAVAWVFFLVGLVPSYVSVFVVEKYYTSFWTGFWNLYGLIVTSVGLGIDGYDFWWIVGLFTTFGFIFLVLLVLLILLELDERDITRRAEGWFVRHLGASWVATSFNWGLYFGFTAGVIWGLVAMIAHGFLMLLLILLASG